MKHTYALIDTANTFFRARHVASRNSDPEEKAAFALHLTLASINMAVRNYKIDHVVVCLEGRSWRKDVYEPYKKNRVVDQMSVTQAEKEENDLFWTTYESLTTFFKEKTNVSVLRHERAEADDMIARFIHLHPEDYHYIISSDSDFTQLISETVAQYNGVTNELIRLDGYWKDNGKPVIDKKTKQQKLLEDPQYLLWKKIIRGDSTDNVFSCYPRAPEKGSKNRVGIREAYEDRNKQGFHYNNFMLQRWSDHNEVEHRVRDDFERNKMLIDLTAQPQDIKDLVDQRIRESVRVNTTPQVGIHFMKFCGKYELTKISEQAETYAKWLNNPYKGQLHEQLTT
jgi:5'-3' exonuclease